MYYAYNKSTKTCIPCKTREEAIHMSQVEMINGAEPTTTIQEQKQTNYPEFLHNYEAMILYIVHRINDVVNDAERNFANYQVIAQVFTASLMKYYITTNRSYSKEKPILASKNYTFKNPVCFEAYSNYFKQVERVLKQKTFATTTNKGEIITPTVYWTEIPSSDLEKLVDDKKMTNHINYMISVLNSKNGYSNLQLILKKLYKRLPSHWKKKKETSKCMQ